MTHASLIHLSGLDVEMEEEEFKQWYRKEYLPTVLARPGWLGARCFECLKGEPEHLTIFDLDPNLLGQRITAAPFHSGITERRGISDYHARTYRLIHEAGHHVVPPKFINVVSVDIEDEFADAFSRWYNDVHFPEILGCPGWLGGRRYECTDGEPRFVAIYDLEDANRPFSTPEYEAAVGWDEHGVYLRGYHGFRIYRLTYDTYAV